MRDDGDGEGAWEDKDSLRPLGAHLLVQVWLPGEVGHGRVNTASEILKNHGDCVLTRSAVCVGVALQLDSRNRSCSLVDEQRGNAKWWPKTRNALPPFAVTNVLEAQTESRGAGLPAVTAA